MSSPLNRNRSASLEKYFYVPSVKRTFDPRGASVLTSTDVRDPRTNKYYDIDTIWHNTTDQRYYILEAIVSNLGRWVLFTGGGGGVITELRADDGNIAEPDGLGRIDVDGNLVANATHALPLFTRADIANTLDIDLQLATTVTPTPADNLNCGVSCYNEDDFTIDATSGMVSLVGGVLAVDQFLTDDGAPPVLPNASGEVEILGGTNITTSGQGPGNTITIDSTGFASFTCLEVTTNVNPMLPFIGYVTNSASLITFTLPVTTAFGEQFVVIRKGAGNVSIAQNAGQTIHYNGVDTTTGATGSLDSNAQWDTIWIKTVTADTDFVVLNSSGTWTAN